MLFSTDHISSTRITTTLVLAAVVGCGVDPRTTEQQSELHRAVRRSGLTGALQLDVPGFPPAAQFVAGFTVERPGDLTCQFRRQVGPCQVEVCQDASSVRFYSAGDVTIAGGNGDPVVLPGTNPTRKYDEVSLPGARWTANDLVTTSAAGGEVPAFSLTQRFPQRLAFSQPDLAAPVLLDPAVGLEVSWTADDVAPVNTAAVINLLEERPEIGTGGSAHARCTFDARAGHALVPGAVLAHFTTSEIAILLTSQTLGSTRAGRFGVQAFAFDVVGLGLGAVR